MNYFLTVYDSGQADTIKMAIAGVTPHVLRPQHLVLGGVDCYTLSGVGELIRIGEAVCIANDWEYRLAEGGTMEQAI